MTTEQLEVYSHAENAAIVRMPERRFPGVVIQGDTLAGLNHLASEMLDALRVLGDTASTEPAEELANRLAVYLQHYEQVLAEHGIELPYVRRSRTET
jgi:hypothetical protein